MEQIQNLVQAGKIEEAIRETEARLSQLSPSDFQWITGKNLLHLQPALTAYLNNCYEVMTAEQDLEVKAMYVEMNSFTTQYQRWFLHVLAYESMPRPGNPDWLADFNGESEKSFTITGYEALQEANKNYMQSEGYRNDDLRQACELHEYLVILRVQELVKHTIGANKGKYAWAALPVLVSAHDYEELMFIME